ncbi:hypothetical protein B0T25DRAFT_543271 [Lasiosphaeria hispida]|uniref:Uncharacterized protein n=1 Tax=Lasiosphaeria hispida TaxID=260671 RepID=A0AAJ0MDZ7_9PEZI|nr:hypothetical protein B0T25DRAFT_561238 [Lasiosphaeria hispida]KAK3352975.1 hypothetical protein B0T25DRAFT_543271 [Lasiosphaeria hispida]
MVYRPKGQKGKKTAEAATKMDSKEFREAAVSSIDEIISYYDNIGERNVVSTVEPGYLRKLLPSEAPADGEPWSDIQQDIEGKILPGITHW